MDIVQKDRERNEMPARVATLAKLPVFWSLEGRRVVVAGGSDAAAWKAELLAACGAHVHVYAIEISETLKALIARGAGHPKGKFVRECRCWHHDMFEGASLAIGDFEEFREAEAFCDAARRAGVPVNVIDKPALCQFQFGSIVNRSPVVVSISTDGATPILAQAIRRRVETLLPHSLKGWGELARSLRGKINERLAAGPQRRAFWERFVDRAFATAPDDGSENAIFADLAHAASHTTDKGRVTLVGAGPGDAELLTLKAVRALQAADVILFDDLVSDEVLELARREAKRMLVGKRGGRESCRQEDINEMMVKFARSGRRVVRLKSGDPMIFGRAGEEIDFLRQRGIEVDVVPGITSASAMASRLGISLTHRDHAQGVRFVTGHSRNGVLPDNLDWSAMADPAITTIYYMAGRTAAEISRELIAAGMPMDAPATIVRSVSRLSERRWVGKLWEMPLAMQEIGFDDPVLIGVGAVFSKAQATARGTTPLAEAV